VLNAGGALVAAWHAEKRERACGVDTMRTLDLARWATETLLTLPDAVGLDRIQDGIVRVATNARLKPSAQTVAHALDLRDELARRLREGAHRPDDIRELYVALGRVCGVLAYLALDLGQAAAAHEHLQAAFQLGDRAEHDQLRAWARGTQALAFRFTKDFERSRDAAADGLKYVSGATGTAEPRLLCGLAASVANLGDSARALELLEQADRARDACSPDEIPGLFSFSPAKQIYYHAFSLMWAEDPKILRKSVKASNDALAAWKVQYSPGDEILTQIYLASASARLGELDNAITAVASVLEEPPSAHFSWVCKQLIQLGGLLGQNFPDSRVATDMCQALRAYVHAARSPMSGPAITSHLNP
jgi:hypothetical protein